MVLGYVWGGFDGRVWGEFSLVVLGDWGGGVGQNCGSVFKGGRLKGNCIVVGRTAVISHDLARSTRPFVCLTFV